MMIETLEQATAVLQDENAAEKDRVDAAHFLGRNKSETAADILLTALDDDDFGGHWAASKGLAQLGDAALPVILKALTSSHCSPRVFEGAKHTFHKSSSQTVQAETKKLLQTMHGSTPDFDTMQAASELMIKLSIT